MASISTLSNDKVFSFQKWYGLNEHPDGDTRLRMGEASKMENWRITRDGNLKLRPGQEFVAGLGPQYDISIGSTNIELATFNENDIIYVSDTISNTARKGTIVLGGGDAGLLERGILSTENASIENGLLTLSDTGWEIQDGVLVNIGSAGTPLTAAELYEVLKGFSDEDQLYTEYENAVYVLYKGSMVKNREGTYTLSGYMVSAKAPDAQTKPIVSMWSGVIGGQDYFLAACNDQVWSLYNASSDQFAASSLGTVKTDKGVSFFQFGGIVYILNGYDYFQYDGINLTSVDGYAPLIAITIGPLDTDTDGNSVNDMPSQAGELTGEYINRLTVKRRVWLSPDGTNKVFRLPESAHSIVKVTDLGTGSAITGYSFTADTTDITFTNVPAQAVNSIEVLYAVDETETTEAMRKQVTGNLFSEFYSGTTDTRVFIYGNGTNKTIYTGMDYDGLPRADYFPDEYEVAIGDSNTPITAMIRHYGALIAFKPSECWALQHGVTELATGDLTPTIYCIPVNREKGNVAPGQVWLVNNSPVTCSGTELYQWTNSSYYTSNLTRDERQARRISDRIQRSIKEIDFKTCRMWDDNDNQEFYVCGDNMALVWNYVTDTWYKYKDFDARAICSFHGDLYVGSHDGKIRRMSDYVVGDEGAAIHAEWVSGAMDFGSPSYRKFSDALWVGLKPVDGTSVDVTVITDRKETFKDKVVSSSKAKVEGQPFMVKTKIKAKKFVYYRLVLKVDKKMRPVIVTNVEARMRLTGDAK